ncbi:MAG: proteasome subunit alpha [Nitrospinaceae bacterium]|nr:MAG: proteasome subunit alpha [Nitrospinaceae bacterium]
MFEEPFRWMEAISTRHSYVREKLKKGQPVLGVPYNEGALLMGFAPQAGKVFEVYDRIAMGALGHPADVERLRMSLLDMAHLEGFNRSAQDVTIARLLQFGIAPALKQNFEEVMRAPYLAQLLLVEITPKNEALFYRLNYDGFWETFKKGCVIAGDPRAMASIEKEIDNTPFATYSLEEALDAACGLWARGLLAAAEEAASDNGEKKEDAPPALKEAFERWPLEAAVLCHKTERPSLYRPLTAGEIDALKNRVAGA